MYKTLVVRFSDYAADTISCHTSILDSSSKVFWGWWKKSDEYDNFKELEALKDKCPINIGIIDRDEEKYYIAKCTEIYLSKDKNSVRSTPDVTYTPDYYSDKEYPAWFELTSIDQIDDTTFCSNFFKIPYGDQTLFTVSDLKINESEIDKVVLNKFPSTKGNSILHISDIHFGTDHNYKDQVNILKEKKLIDIIKPILKPYRNDIGIIVASGDFISKANIGQYCNSFEDAHLFLRQLLTYFGLSPKNLIIIPGNHDMPLLDNGIDPHQEGNYTSQFRQFRKDVKEVPPHKEIEFWAGYKTPSEWNIIFSYFNSAELKFKYLSNFGYLEKEKYNRIFQNINTSLGITNQKDFISKKIINFCVIHHHLKMFMPTQEMSWPDDPNHKDIKCQSVSVLLNAGKFEEDAINSGMHFLLHGHQHLPYVGSTGIIQKKTRKNLNVLSVGSAGSKLEKGYVNQGPYNSFSIYTPQEKHLKVIVEKYNTEGIYGVKEEYEVPYL
jgi:predicted MPP superfamily phosphohydrolase